MKTLSLRCVALASAMSGAAALSGCGDDDIVEALRTTTEPNRPSPSAPDAGAPAQPGAPAPATSGSSSASADAGPSAPSPVATPDASTPAPALPQGSLAVGERPESAQFDPVTNAWYVSVQGSTDVPGDGYIVQLNADATAIVNERFVTGLSEPKGIRIHEGRLFVADGADLVTVDVATGVVQSRASVVGIDPGVPEVPFLNDVAVRPSSGFVYVSDNRNNVLFRFQPDGTQPILLLSSPTLEAPNGLLVDERDGEDNARLLVAALGPGLDPVLGVTERLGAVYAISIADLTDGGAATVSYLTQRIGNLDGIELSGNDLIVTDIIGGRLLRVTPSTTTPPPFGEGDAVVLRSGLTRAADLGLDPVRGLVVVPETASGRVTALTLD